MCVCVCIHSCDVRCRGKREESFEIEMTDLVILCFFYRPQCLFLGYVMCDLCLCASYVFCVFVQVMCDLCFCVSYV